MATPQQAKGRTAVPILRRSLNRRRWGGPLESGDFVLGDPPSRAMVGSDRVTLIHA